MKPSPDTFGNFLLREGDAHFKAIPKKLERAANGGWAVHV
jgi:hypothetical protein